MLRQAAGESFGPQAPVDVELLEAHCLQGPRGDLGDQRQDVRAAEVGEALLVVEGIVRARPGSVVTPTEIELPPVAETN